MRKFLVFLVLFAVLSIAMLGCIGPAPPQPQGNESNDTNASIAPKKNPNFIISSPKNGDVIKTNASSADVQISLSTTDVILKQPGGAAKNGEGHFHIILDNQAVLDVSAKTYTLQNVGIGEHTLKIELVNNDHTSYSPKITKTVYFTVEKEAILKPKTVEVVIGDFSYTPSDITIKVGDSVKWINNGKFPRSVTAADQTFNSLIASGSSYTFTFTKAGTYEYSSTNWPDMHGKIIVEQN